MTGPISIEAGGRTLRGDIHSGSPTDPEGSMPGVLFVHGLRSDRTGYRERAESVAAATGGVCLTFDLSGHGESSAEFGQLTRRDHLTDVVAAYDELISTAGADPARIGVCGASYGGYLAALLVGRRTIRRLFLRAPALYDDALFDVPLGNVVRSSATARSDLLVGSLGQFHHEVLILESGSDESIPHAIIESYLRLATSAGHEVIDGASHALTEPAWREQFRRTLVRFFEPL